MDMNAIRQQYPHEIYADAVDSFKPIELFNSEGYSHKKQLTAANIVSDVKGAILEAEGTLPFFAELYNISPNLKDYVMVPTVIMPSDLPNRNLIAFPKEELLRPNSSSGCLGYQSWRNKISAKDHVNRKIPEDCKGIIFSSFIKPLKGVKGNLLKVMTLLGFDRYRDPALANAILTGQRSAYSMGAFCGYYTCSICGARHPEMACEHVEIPTKEMKRPLKLWADSDGRLAYLKARNIVGFEVSSVVNPAYLSAKTDKNEIITLF